MKQALTCSYPLRMTEEEKAILQRLQAEGGESMNGALRRLIRETDRRGELLRAFTITGITSESDMLLSHDRCPKVLETHLPVDVATLLTSLELHTRYQCAGGEKG